MSLSNPKDEAFANYLLTEPTATAAYYKAYPNAKKWKPETVHNKAAAKARSSEILARLDELKQELARKCSWTRERAVQVFMEIIDRKKDEEAGTRPAMDKDRIASAKALNDMCGYNAPVEQNVNVKTAPDINFHFKKAME